MKIGPEENRPVYKFNGCHTDSFAWLEVGQCVGCGEKKMCWEIDGSNGEYAGAFLCVTCLKEMVSVLEQMVTVQERSDFS